MCYMCEQKQQVQQSVNSNLIWNPKVQKLSIAELADAVRRAATNDPDKVYERPDGGACLYTHDVPNSDKKVPGCIVGQGVFDATGKVVDNFALRGVVCNSNWLEALNVPGEFDDYGDLVIAGDPLTRYLAAWLKAVQSQQDDGERWADAVAFADRTTRFAKYADAS